MKNFILMTLVILTFACPTFAQFTTVNYDFDRNWFNEGQPLPAEESMILKGMVPSSTEIVEFTILSSKRGDELYKSVWYKNMDNEMKLLVPFKLRSSETYDFNINFYKACNSSDKEELITRLTTMLDTYVDVNLSQQKGIKFSQRTRKIVAEMNELLQVESKNFKSNIASWEPMFSSLVALKLDQLEKINLTEEFNKKDSTKDKRGVRKSNKNNLVQDLKTQIHKEIQKIFSQELFLIEDSRLVDNYPTEEKQNNLAINVGYGGAYISGNWDDLNYGSSPYLGLAFPLGNSVLGSKFLSNSSVTLGVFLNNFEDNQGNTITGFIVDRPFYVGLDHKLFKFIRVNAGAAFLEESIATGTDSVKKNVMIRPFLGLSARIDLSLGLGK